MKTVEYPESDGEPMAETEIHRELMTDLIHALDTYFSEDPLIHVSGNLLMYYVEGDPSRSVAPDVFVVRGIDKQPRTTYLVWKEGRVPDVVIELSSKKTWQADLQKKWKLYAQLGIKEYFLYDPLREYLVEPLAAYRLEAEGEYQPVPVVQGRVRSETLGLELVDTGETLRLYDPVGQQFLPTAREEHAARRRAEAERQAEAEARQRAEAEVARLREELERRRRE